jgi:hypothetical protein
MSNIILEVAIHFTPYASSNLSVSKLFDGVKNEMLKSLLIMWILRFYFSHSLQTLPLISFGHSEYGHVVAYHVVATVGQWRT